MGAERDCRYAEMLLSMGREDAQRLATERARSRHSVALWVAHELAEQSRRLDIPAALAQSMRETADTIRAEHRRSTAILRHAG